MYKLKNIIHWHHLLQKCQSLTPFQLKKAKQLGFSDKQLGKLRHSSEDVIRELRKKEGIRPWVKQIDTLAAEWPAKTNYLFLVIFETFLTASL